MAALAAASGVASTSTSKALLATLPAPSPAPSTFATLLHRSKFASYDPHIKQVYSAPPASAHRGDFGLKRPLPLRRKNAFITVKAVDSRAQQTEWNHGESQARFIRRWEELGTLAKARAGGEKGWERTLGLEATEWRTDSDFYDREAEFKSPHPPPSGALRGSLLGSTTPASLLDSKSYSKKSDARASQVNSAQLAPNLESMNPSEFKRFLHKCRELRPKFKEYLASIPELKGKSLYDISQNTMAEYHRLFLQQHMHELFGSGGSRSSEATTPTSRLIEQKPHPTAALLYSHPSMLTTYFTTPAQPGLVLQEHWVDRRKAQGSDALLAPTWSPGAVYGNGGVNARDPVFFTSFAGTTAILRERNAHGKKPLLDVNSEEGVTISKSTYASSDDIALEYDELLEEGARTTYAEAESYDHEARMRIINNPVLNVAPKVVGYSPEGLKGANVSVEVIVEGEVFDVSAEQGRSKDFRRENPYEPGSRDYILGGIGTKNEIVPLSVSFQSRPRRDALTSEKLKRSTTMLAQASLGAAATDPLLDKLRHIVIGPASDGYKIPTGEEDEWTDD